MGYRVMSVAICFACVAVQGVAAAQSKLYTFRGQAACEYYGTTVGRAGDVNADGFQDLIVGAIGDSTNVYQAGMFQVLSGRDGTVLHSVYGSTPLGHLGTSVGGAGDVDGDGFDDLIAGAPHVNDGEVYVVSGGDGSILHQLYEGTSGYGLSVGVGGDLDGDGLADILETARGLAEVRSGADAAVIHGLLPPVPVAFGFGATCCFVGDVNGDGVDDFAVGAPSDRSSGAQRGSVYVFSGADRSILFRIDGDASFDLFGSSMAPAGDVNADGVPDLIVGAEQDMYTRSGYVRVCSGIDGSTLHTFRAFGPGDDASQGAGIGDVNGDGFDDIAVSARKALQPSGGYGAVQVMSGKDGRLIASLSAEAADRVYGTSIAGLGDVNGDGHPDLAIGIPGGVAPPGGVDNVGTAIVISGACFAVRPYCQGGLNSTGERASMYSAGTTSLFDATYSLGAMDLPPGNPGLFFFGDAQLQAPFGDGLRCVGGRTFRVPSFVQASPAGTVEKPLDLTATPISAGSTWNFQLWYRDSGPAGFNLTDALEVTFCQ